MYEVKHKDPILRTFMIFTQTADAVLKCGDAHLFRKADLSVIKLIVLQLLAANGGTAEPSQLAGWALRERHDITTLIRRMRRDGLVTTERSEKDHRFINITLTRKGQRLLDRARPLKKEFIDHLMSSISEQDALLLEKLLSILKQNALNGLESLTKRSKRQPA